MLQEGLVSRFAADPGITALIGTPQSRPDGSNGVFPVTMPQGAPLPCIVYMKVAGHEIDSMDGRGELRVSRVQIAGYGTQYGDAAKTAEAAKDAIVGFKGLLDDGTQIDAVFLVLESDAFESVPKIYQEPFDVEIWYRNANS